MLREERDEGLSYSSLRECDIYSRFYCSFMVTVYRMEVQDHQVCLWMGLADMSLQQYLEQSPAPSFSQRLRLAGQLLWSALNFLNYLHTYNVLHRDIKPDNVLLQRRSTNDTLYNIYLSDMGSCRWFSRGIKLTSGMGTRCFRPPEMDSQVYGKPGDVYGLAVTTIYLLHGMHPVEGNNPQTTPEQWQQTLAVYQSFIPVSLFDLLHNMILSRDAHRITVGDALQHEFFQEASVPPVPKMLSVPFPGHYWNRFGILADDRRQSIDMLIDLGASYAFSPLTIVHAVHMFDDFWKECLPVLGQNKIAFELYAYVAIWVAGKYFEQYAMPLGELIQHSRQRFKVDDFIDAEEQIVTTLGFRLVRRNVPKQITTKSTIPLLKQLLSSPDYTLGKCATRISSRLSSYSR